MPIEFDELNNPIYTYGCYTPSSGANTYENRVSIRTPFWSDFVSPLGEVALKLVLINPQAFTVRHDLVQAIPYYQPPEDIILPPPSPVPVSDKNYDGEINSADLADFLIAWFDQKSSADLNLDDVVDQADLDVFVARFLEGT